MSFKLAVTIAGAVSLGSFEAGVVFEVLDALGQHNQAVPAHDQIHIDVLTGASAGGMTAVIAAQSLLYSAPALAHPYDNAFYNAWVTGVDIKGLLPLQATESACQSVLSSNFVKSLAQKLVLGRYDQNPVPPQVSHPALTPSRTVRVGLALSNLNGVDYERPLLSGGTFNYTQFEDQIEFALDESTDTQADWEPVTDAAVACGAFPFAFRPCQLSRGVKQYHRRFLAPWVNSPRDFMYTDGGVFQNQPIGLAKNLVDINDDHQNSDKRFYLFVSPQAVGPTVSGITVGANFQDMTTALVNAIYNQAGFQDWIEAESVNDAVDQLNQRAADLLAFLKCGVILESPLKGVTSNLLPYLQPSTTRLQFARIRLQKQFAAEYHDLSASLGAPLADVWIDIVLLLELAANLHEKDEMQIFSITTDRKDLAGAGFFSFLGFLDLGFRQHDYDLGREKAQSSLNDLKQISGGKLPDLIWQPKPINPVQKTPPNGFTPEMIPEQNRKDLYQALSNAADNMLAQDGVSWVVRKGIETFYLNGKIKNILGM